MCVNVQYTPFSFVATDTELHIKVLCFFKCPNLDARHHDNVLFAIALQVYDQSSCYCYTCFMSFVLLHDSVWSGPSTGSFCQSVALIQHIYC